MSTAQISRIQKNASKISPLLALLACMAVSQPSFGVTSNRIPAGGDIGRIVGDPAHPVTEAGLAQVVPKIYGQLPEFMDASTLRSLATLIKLKGSKSGVLISAFQSDWKEMRTDSALANRVHDEFASQPIKVMCLPKDSSITSGPTGNYLREILSNIRANEVLTSLSKWVGTEVIKVDLGQRKAIVNLLDARRAAYSREIGDQIIQQWIENVPADMANCTRKSI